MSILITGITSGGGGGGGGTTFSSTALILSSIRLNGASGRRGGSTSGILAAVRTVVTPSARRGGSSSVNAPVSLFVAPGARRGGTAGIRASIRVNGASGRRGGSTASVLASIALKPASGRRGGSTASVLASIALNPASGRRGGSTARVQSSILPGGSPYKRIGALALFINAARLSAISARVPPVIVEPAGKSIMRNKIRVLDNDRYSSRGVQFDGDNSFTVKLTQNEAGRLEIYYDHLLESGDYVVSVVATISGETPPVISLNVAGTIATMIVSGGGFGREMTIVATTFLTLKDEIRLCIRDYVRPRARPRDY